MFNNCLIHVIIFNLIIFYIQLMTNKTLINVYLIRKIINNLKSDWKEEIDTSLNSGIEVKSPIIYGNDQKRMGQSGVCHQLCRTCDRFPHRSGRDRSLFLWLSEGKLAGLI